MKEKKEILKELEDCKKLIATGQTEIAISKLLNFNEKSDNEILLVSSRWKTLKNNMIQGVINNYEFFIENNSINKSLLELIGNYLEQNKNKLSEEETAKKKSNSNTKSPSIRYLHQIKTGRDLIKMIEDSDANRISRGDIKSQEEVLLIGDFLEDVCDYAELCDIESPNFNHKRSLEKELEFNTKLKELEKANFIVFGKLRKMIFTNSEIRYNLAELMITRKDNKMIQKIKETNQLCLPTLIYDS